MARVWIRCVKFHVYVRWKTGRSRYCLDRTVHDERYRSSRVMSKENVIEFLAKAAEDDQLKDELQTVASEGELVDLGKEKGFEFSSDHVEEAIADLKQKPGFFSALAAAVVEIFSPAQDDYPAIGVQPFSGEPNRKS